MRRFLVAMVVTLLIAGAAALGFKFWQDYSSLKTSEQTTRDRYAETIDALGQIQDSLDAIALGDTTVRLLSQNLDAEQNLTQPIQREALDRIAELRGSILRSKERIRRLESDLKKRGIKVAGLEKLIAGLRRTVAEKEGLITQLSGTVDSLHSQVAGLAAEVAQSQEGIRAREQTIEERRRELATVYYIVGAKRELSASGVIVAKGGFLGLGRSLQPSGHINDDALTALDTDQETIIQVPSTRVRVLSAQPTSSYELKLVDGRMELHILDPRQFRKVRQLIILTA
jgi:peptidoglycan hydrolase CwlO-like protein